MSILIHKALKYAELKHRGQKRKVSGADYITHPIMVSYLAANYKRSKALETLICAAILHDTVEDTNASYNDILQRYPTPVWDARSLYRVRAHLGPRGPEGCRKAGIPQGSYGWNVQLRPFPEALRPFG